MFREWILHLPKALWELGDKNPITTEVRHLLPYCVLISKPHFLVNFIVPPSSNTAPIVDGRYGSKYHFFSHVYNYSGTTLYTDHFSPSAKI